MIQIAIGMKTMILLFPLARCFDFPLVGLIAYSAQKRAKSEPNKQVIRLMGY